MRRYLTKAKSQVMILSKARTPPLLTHAFLFEETPLTFTDAVKWLGVTH